MTRVAQHRVPLVIALAVAGLTLVGCSKPEPPDKDRPPEPTAASTVADKPSALREYMQTPIDKAKTAEPTVLEAAKQQEAAIDAQTAGNATSGSAPGY